MRLSAAERERDHLVRVKQANVYKCLISIQSHNRIVRVTPCFRPFRLFLHVQLMHVQQTCVNRNRRTSSGKNKPFACVALYLGSSIPGLCLRPHITLANVLKMLGRNSVSSGVSTVEGPAGVWRSKIQLFATIKIGVFFYISS